MKPTERPWAVDAPSLTLPRLRDNERQPSLRHLPLTPSRPQRIPLNLAEASPGDSSPTMPSRKTTSAPSPARTPPPATAARLVAAQPCPLPPELAPSKARGMKKQEILEWGSLETQEAGHGHENTLQNPRLTPRFSGTFTPGQHENRELFTRNQNEVGNFFTRNENELGNFFRPNRELPASSLPLRLPLWKIREGASRPVLYSRSL